MPDYSYREAVMNAEIRQQTPFGVMGKIAHQFPDKNPYLVAEEMSRFGVLGAIAAAYPGHSPVALAMEMVGSSPIAEALQRLGDELAEFNE